MAKNHRSEACLSFWLRRYIVYAFSIITWFHWLYTYILKLVSPGLMKQFKTPIKFIDAFESLRLSYVCLCTSLYAPSVLKLIASRYSWAFRLQLTFLCVFFSVVSQRDGKQDSSPHQNHIRLEFLSSSDNKEAVVEAANLLFEKYLDSCNLGDDKGENIFTEAHLTEALTDIGSYYFSNGILINVSLSRRN